MTIFWGCKEYVARIRPNLPEKLCATHFLAKNCLELLQLLVHYIFLYQVAIDLKIEHLALDIWFFITN